MRARYFGAVVRYSLAVGVLALSLTACGTPDRELTPEELQRGVSDALRQAGRAHESVRCSEAVKAQAAESTTCTMTSSGRRFKVTVIVQEVTGDKANYEVEVDPEALP